MWIHYNPNPLGKSVGDCVLRAMTFVTDSTWKDIYLAISMKGVELGDLPNALHVWGKVMIDLGWTPRMLLDDCPRCKTVRDFCYEYPYGTYLLTGDSHAVAVKDGNYYDDWDSGDVVPIYYFYKKG